MEIIYGNYIEIIYIYIYMELIYYVWGVMIHCMLHFRTGSDTPPCFQLLGCIPFTELRCIDLGMTYRYKFSTYI